MKKSYFSRVALQNISVSTGTFAVSNSSNVLGLARGADGSATIVLSTPFSINTPNVKDGKQVGIRPLQVVVQLNVGAAALTEAPTMAFYRVAVDGTSAPSATAISGTLSGYSATTGNQVLTYDLAYQGEALLDVLAKIHAELTVKPDTATTLSIQDVILKYELVEDAQD